jgi:type II secretory pathway pseudopilin PulG
MNSSPQYRLGISRLEVTIVVVVVCGAAAMIAGWAASPKTAALREQCLAQLGDIGKALGQYLKDHDDRWPYAAKLRTFEMHDPPWPTLPVTLAPYLGTRPNLFACPADRRVLPADSPLVKQFPVKTTWFATEGTSYEWMWGEAYGGNKVGQESTSKAGTLGGADRADQPLLADFGTFHGGDRGSPFNTLFADLRARPARTKSKG